MIYVENNNKTSHWIVTSKCISYLNIGEDIDAELENI